MADLPHWLTITLGGLAGAGLRLLLGARLGAFPTAEAFCGLLLGLAVGWAQRQPESFAPHEATQWLFIGFVALGPNLREDPRGTAMQRLILTLAAACAGLAAGVYLLR